MKVTSCFLLRMSYILIQIFKKNKQYFWRKFFALIHSSQSNPIHLSQSKELKVLCERTRNRNVVCTAPLISNANLCYHFSAHIAVKNLRYLARFLVVSFLVRDYSLINEVIIVSDRWLMWYKVFLCPTNFIHRPFFPY